MILATDRLLLRPWRDTDLAPFFAMCADPEVMRYFEHTLDLVGVQALLITLTMRAARDGFGMWAVEVPGMADFIGFAGIQCVPFEAPFTPAVEIGWRLARPFWGYGYATEAAKAALEDGFGRCGLAEIVSMAVPANRRSIAVMERIGMHRDREGDFPHPGVSPGHDLQHHVLYRMSATDDRALT